MTSAVDKKTMRGGSIVREDPLPGELDFGGDGVESLNKLEDIDDGDMPEILEDEPSFPNTAVDKDTGDFLYALQFDMDPPIIKGFTTVRIPQKIYARNVRHSSQGKTDGEAMFYLICSCARLPTEVVDRLDARDYIILQKIVSHISTKNSDAVQKALGTSGG